MTTTSPPPSLLAQAAAGGPASSSGAAGMRFTVDGWDPTYGTSLELEEDLGQTTVDVNVDVEVPEANWRPLDPNPTVTRPPAMLFVDGVRRIEARVWIDEVTAGVPATEASAAMCASYAAGVVCCCESGAHLLTIEARRGLFTIAPHAVNVETFAGIYAACHTPPRPAIPLSVTLSSALQRRLGDLEVIVAVAARNELAAHGVSGDDLLVVDGPLHGRDHLPRAIGFIKSHRTAYLPPPLHAMVGTLSGGQRTPVFLMGTSWERHSWYLRLPCRPGSPWAGVVRIECSPDLPRDEVIQLANLSQATLCRYASTEYKDARAPQNLYPIAGLERELRHRLGDPKLLYRALRVAAAV